MFGAKYSRLKFWIWSIILIVLITPISIIINAPIGDMENINLSTTLLIILIYILWINTLANRIRDYGSNPWISLWVIVPIVDIIVTFYYGIKQYKIVSNDNYSSFRKDEYKDSLNTSSFNSQSISNTNVNISEDNIELNEDEIYEKIMIEIEEDKRIKSTWAKALSQSDGDDKKANSLYINLRFNQIKENVIKIKFEKELFIEKNLSITEKNFLNKFDCNEKSINVDIDNTIIKIKNRNSIHCFNRDTLKEYTVEKVVEKVVEKKEIIDASIPKYSSAFEKARADYLLDYKKRIN